MLIKKNRYIFFIFTFIFALCSSHYSLAYDSNARQDWREIQKFIDNELLPLNKKSRETLLEVRTISGNVKQRQGSNRVTEQEIYRLNFLVNDLSESSENLVYKLDKLPVKTSYAKEVVANMKEIALLGFKMNELGVRGIRLAINGIVDTNLENELEEMRIKGESLNSKFVLSLERLMSFVK
ncbi:hypothetical protein [Mannheimia indoligenes]|uniref:hypothetical protein n=1 Tax=Mannheimia indoligenes TaxID=3103145 RepID=UPI002FE58165